MVSKISLNIYNVPEPTFPISSHNIGVPPKQDPAPRYTLLKPRSPKACSWVPDQRLSSRGKTQPRPSAQKVSTENVCLWDQLSNNQERGTIRRLFFPTATQSTSNWKSLGVPRRVCPNLTILDIGFHLRARWVSETTAESTQPKAGRKPRSQNLLCE